MTARCRILFVIDSLGFGGAERQLVELVKGLSRKDCYEIHLVSLMRRDEGYAEIVAALGIDVQYFPRGRKYEVVGPLFRLVRYMREHRIDLVHTFMNMGSLFGVSAARIARRPVVCSAIRDARDKSWKERYLKRILARFSDIYVANSRSGFTNRFRKMQPHFRVIYNGVDFARFTGFGGSRAALRAELGMTGFRRIVGMVGSLSQYKDQETLLEAAPGVLKVFPDTGFLFVGDGEKRATLEKRVEKLGLGRHMVLTGFREDVDRLYPLMDVCVLLTNARLIEEGISNAILEAMACGIPVIASAGGGTDEIVEHERSGLVVSPHDPKGTAAAIIRLLTVPGAEAEKLASQAIVNVREMFALERYREDYEIIYRDLIDAQFCKKEMWQRNSTKH